MDPALRHAWTEVISADDYEAHMAAIGQAQAAASLTEWLLTEARLASEARITIVGAGTGQMFDFLDTALFIPYTLTCADLNPAFLALLNTRLAKHGLNAEIVQDDLENTRLAPGADLLLATLVLEHIDWQAGVEAICRLQPRMCGIVMQVNPAGMQSAITPGRVLPPSMQAAAESWHPLLLSGTELTASLEARGYSCLQQRSLEVADRKQLRALLFARVPAPSQERGSGTTSVSSRYESPPAK
jgi:hypothetical protein